MPVAVDMATVDRRREGWSQSAAELSPLRGKGGRKRGKQQAAASRVLDLAFRNFLQHRGPHEETPENFLRARGRDRSRPKRPPAVPELNILTETCPAPVRKRLVESPPPGMRCVFFSQHEKGGTRPGALNPSRVLRFRRLHSPSPHLSFAPSGSGRRRSAGAPGSPTTTPVSPKQRPFSAPAASLAAQPPLLGFSTASVGSGVGAARSGNRRAVAKFVQTQLGIFDRKCGLTHAESDDDAADANEAAALRAQQEGLLKEHEALYQQGAFATSAARVGSPARELLNLAEDPCETASECAKVMHLVREVKRSSALVRLVNHIALQDAKFMFGRPPGGDQFTIRVREFRETLTNESRGVLTQQQVAQLWRMFEHPQSDEHDRWMNGERWLLSCHFVWRARGGDREAILKTFYYMLQLRADREGGLDRVSVDVSELQLALSAYRSKRRHSLALVALIDSTLVFGYPWKVRRSPLDTFVNAVAKNQRLLDAFVGLPDTQYVHEPRN
eukprot:TRINITY_DN35585_c0_g1_i1.p1 TRINITY_DN35585_c0_g1~~TRINITY_DN35585_c0_g1_i1.p1  ORF type:complete len:501 (+),score=102.03 TRINITY_DN35585_c0_g1_i1:46-1548(+)